MKILFKLKLFSVMKENESVFDERMTNEYVKVQSNLFSFLRIIILAVVLLDSFSLYDTAYKILYYSFFVAFWIEPMLISMKGLWNKVSDGMIKVFSGCIMAMIITLEVLSIVLVDQNVWNVVIILFLGIISAIASYFLYRNAYIKYINEQSEE